MDKDSTNPFLSERLYQQRVEEAKMYHLTKPKQSPEEVTAQYELLERLSGQTRQSRRVKDAEPPASGNSEG